MIGFIKWLYYLATDPTGQNPVLCFIMILAVATVVIAIWSSCYRSKAERAERNHWMEKSDEKKAEQRKQRKQQRG